MPIEVAAAGDPAALVVATLFATKLIEGAGSEIGRRLVSVGDRLNALIGRRSAEDADTQAAVAMLERRPDHPGRVEALAELLAEAAEQDPGFAEELGALVDAAREAGLVAEESDQGGITIGGFHVRGNLEVSGDQNIVVGGDYQAGLTPHEGDPSPRT